MKPSLTKMIHALDEAIEICRKDNVPDDVIAIAILRHGRKIAKSAGLQSSEIARLVLF